MPATRTVLHTGTRANGDSVEHILRVDPDAEGRDVVVFTERYRFDDELEYDPAEYSYTVGVGTDGLTALGPNIAAELHRRYASGELDPARPQGEARARVLRLFEDAGVRTQRGGRPRTETLWQQGEVRVELGISTYSGYLDLNEWHPDLNLYQIHLRPEAHVGLLAVAEDRAGAQRGLPDDRLVAAWRALAAQFRPGRPGAIRDQIADWLHASRMAFDSYGTEWKETLLKVYRPATDCVFELRLLLDTADERRGVTFTEFYDYLPGSSDAGREYMYSAQAPRADLDRLADALGTGPGDPDERLIAGLRAKVAAGDLADELAIKQNRDRVARWFRSAGAHVEEKSSSWVNTDW